MGLELYRDILRGLHSKLVQVLPSEYEVKYLDKYKYSSPFSMASESVEVTLALQHSLIEQCFFRIVQLDYFGNAEIRCENYKGTKVLDLKDPALFDNILTDIDEFRHHRVRDADGSRDDDIRKKQIETMIKEHLPRVAGVTYKAYFLIPINGPIRVQLTCSYRNFHFLEFLFDKMPLPHIARGTYIIKGFANGDYLMDSKQAFDNITITGVHRIILDVLYGRVSRYFNGPQHLHMPVQAR